MSANQPQVFTGDLILPGKVLSDGMLSVEQGRIARIGTRDEITKEYAAKGVKLAPHKPDRAWRYIAPGYIDLHVHGGNGADFMDGTPAAFETAITAHTRHGTTSIVPTTTSGSMDQIIRVLELTRDFQARSTQGARVLGAHVYGPFFQVNARGCHPASGIREPSPDEYQKYLELSAHIASLTIAPEIAHSEALARACHERGILVTVGHSHATFPQMHEAIQWGARHVDHLYCAMSDKTRLRQSQTYPMRGGVLEATLYFDELTTEVIADGKHLSADLLLLALKIKGTERLALVTDCNRALDLPDGDYLFGPLDGGEPFVRRDEVGLMPDGMALASSVQGMDHMVRTMVNSTGVSIPTAVEMASLTPARIIGWDDRIGSLAPGKFADFLLLDDALNVVEVFVGGNRLFP